MKREQRFKRRSKAELADVVRLIEINNEKSNKQKETKGKSIIVIPKHHRPTDGA